MKAEFQAEHRNPRPLPAFVLGTLAMLALASFSQATSVALTEGKVLFLRSGSYTWAQVSRGQMLNPGDQLKTATGARAAVAFDDGSRVELNPGSSFVLRETTPQASEMSLTLGSIKAFISKSFTRRFSVRTPTAVAAVRGTEFTVEVAPNGDTHIQMFNGLLAVGDTKGNEVLIKDTQSIDVTAAGLGKTADPAQGGDRGTGASAKDIARREVGLEMSKEEVQAAAAIEQKSAVYREGKALIDVHGNRVRLEEYIIRPADNQFKLVVLNERIDRFDYFFFLGTFDQTLPDDMSVALRQMAGCIGAPCQYNLDSYITGRSNTIDKVMETATGGHQVDVNNNGAYAGDDVTAAFDPVTDKFVSLSAGTPFFETLFDNYSIAYNDVVHQSWASAVGPNIPSMESGVAVNFTNLTTLQTAPGCAPPDCTYFEDGVQHHVFYSADGTGTIWDKYDNYIISDDGKIATTAAFSGATTGDAYKKLLLGWNFQQIVTASEFGGRSINLVVEPKIFIKSGLIP